MAREDWVKKKAEWNSLPPDVRRRISLQWERPVKKRKKHGRIGFGMPSGRRKPRVRRDTRSADDMFNYGYDPTLG